MKMLKMDLNFHELIISFSYIFVVIAEPLNFIVPYSDAHHATLAFVITFENKLFWL